MEANGVTVDHDDADLQHGDALVLDGRWPWPASEGPDPRETNLLLEHLAAKVTHWRRLASRYGALGPGTGQPETAALVVMGQFIYDTCAEELASVLAALPAADSGGCAREGAA